MALRIELGATLGRRRFEPATGARRPSPEIPNGVVLGRVSELIFETNLSEVGSPLADAVLGAREHAAYEGKSIFDTRPKAGGVFPAKIKQTLVVSSAKNTPPLIQPDGQIGLVADQIKGFVSHRIFVPMERRTAFGFCHFVHDGLPGAFRDYLAISGSVAERYVRAMWRLRMGGLPVGLVFSVQEGLGFASVPGAQACLLSGGVILVVENATSAIERETELHVRAPNPSTDQTVRVSEQWASFSGVAWVVNVQRVIVNPY